ncbi:hypothetical protein ACKI2N_019880 [Cupriavidus sp. 30B13]|uniref:hypothetical protein n=1 Tax=Cupriavidus sp. 30B13 TaxID=3384241 RepID=UPI003B8FF327
MARLLENGKAKEGEEGETMETGPMRGVAHRLASIMAIARRPIIHAGLEALLAGI